MLFRYLTLYQTLFRYGILRTHEIPFLRKMVEIFPKDFAACPQAMRHKRYAASPTFLAANGIHFARTVQLPGEIIVTRCRAYHQVFDLGRNLAQAINIGTKSWIDFGLDSKKCKCPSDL